MKWDESFAGNNSVINSINRLGDLYRGQGKLKEAEEMYGRALEGYEKTLRCDHTSTLNTVNNLGNLYRDQDKRKEAEEMYGGRFLSVVLGYTALTVLIVFVIAIELGKIVAFIYR